MKNFLYIFVLLAVFSILQSCSNTENLSEDSSELIEITKQQFVANGMEMGKIETKIFETQVKSNGVIEPMPNGIANISVPVSGKISNISSFNGKYVKQHEVLMQVSGNSVIDIQKEFAEAAAVFRRSKNEFDRVKSLFTDKVISEKEYVISESEFKSALARYNGLKMKIEAIGLSTSKIENGDFQISYSIKAPISGYVSNQKVHLGSFVDSQSEILEVINPDLFQLKLVVFANEISQIKQGQSVKFKSINSDGFSFARIITTGVMVDEATKSIICYAALNEKNQPQLIANNFIEAEIITGVDTVFAIPAEAIIKQESSAFVLILKKQDDEKFQFEKRIVKIGAQFNGFVEIIGGNIEGSILVKGVYNIVL